jgi:hypothetical protein
MSTTPLDFSLTDLASIKTEVDTGLSALVTALTFAEKFSTFLPGNLGADLAVAVKILGELKSLLDKL